MKMRVGIFLLLLSSCVCSGSETSRIWARGEGELSPKNLVSNAGFEADISYSGSVGNWLAYSNPEVLSWMSKQGRIDVGSCSAKVDGSWQIVLPDAPIMDVSGIINITAVLEEYEPGKIMPGGRVVLKEKGKPPSKDDDIDCKYTYFSRARNGRGSVRISSARKAHGIWRQDIPYSVIPKGTKKIYGRIYVSGTNAVGVVQLMCRSNCKDGSSYQAPAVSLPVNGDFDWRLLTIRFGDTREISSFGVYVSATLTGTVWLDDALFVPAVTEIGFSSGEENLKRIRVIEQFQGDGASREFPFSVGERPGDVFVGEDQCPAWEGGFNYLIDFQDSTILFREPIDAGKTVSLILYEASDPAKDFTGLIKEAFALHTYVLEAKAKNGKVHRFYCPMKK